MQAATAPPRGCEQPPPNGPAAPSRMMPTLSVTLIPSEDAWGDR